MAKRAPNKIKTIRDKTPAANELVLVPVADWNKYFAWPTVSGLRHLIFDGDNNGFNHCVRHVGKRVLIHTPSFMKWVDQQDKQYHLRNNHKKPGNTR